MNQNQCRRCHKPIDQNAQLLLMGKAGDVCPDCATPEEYRRIITAQTREMRQDFGDAIQSVTL